MKLNTDHWQQLAADLKGQVRMTGHPPAPDFHFLSTDTRSLQGSPEALRQTLFIALKGPRHDGHIYVSQAAERGVGGFILANDWPGDDPEGHVLRVPDTLAALQAIGTLARQHLPGTVVGITGSNGKTTIKEWAFTLAGAGQRVSRSPGSWNSQLGVPLALWGLDPDAEIHLVEAGISEPGEMARLTDMIQPEVGVMTHFGDAHEAHFPDRMTKALEKTALFAGCKTLILGTHSPEICQALRQRRLEHISAYWTLPDSIHPDLPHPPALSIDKIEATDGAQRMTGQWRGTPLSWSLPFSDGASTANALTAGLLMLELGTPPDTVAERIGQLQPVGMRLEHLAGQGGGTIINDTWNHDLDGLATALDTLGRLPGKGKSAVVMSDLIPFDTGDRDQMDRLAAVLSRHQVDRWIGVGSHFKQGLPGVPNDAYRHFDATEALLDSAELDGLEGWNVLVKGARPFAFERVAKALEANPHTTVLDLDLGRLSHNLQVYRDAFRCPIMGMVKAFAYGAGESVAVELDRLGIDRLAVAFAEEGIQLRKKGVQCPILVLNAEPQRYPDLIQWNLEPEIHNVAHLELWRRAASQNVAASGRGVHLKVETGMHRLGIGAEDWKEAGRLCAGLGIPIISVYSHLSAADDPSADSHTRQQLEVYTRACGAIESGWMEAEGTNERPVFMRHIANTAGAARFPEARLDMVRIGIGLYGIDSSGQLAGLKPVGRFHTRISHIHRVPAGAPVGYGARDVAEHDRTIATLPVGYADGLPRNAGMGAATLHAGGKASPTAGPVCMDGCMIDVTGMDVNVGDPVEIFGDSAPIEQLAEATGTIPYELLCRIPPRVRRRHLRT